MPKYCGECGSPTLPTDEGRCTQNPTYHDVYYEELGSFEDDDDWYDEAHSWEESEYERILDQAVERSQR